MKAVEQIMCRAPVIPVLGIERTNQARDLAAALLTGVLCVLVTLRTPAALKAIRKCER